MLDKEKMQKLEEFGGRSGLQIRNELAAVMQEQNGELLHAVSNYFDDVAKRKRRIADRVNHLQEQRKELENKIASYGPRLAAATISGDSGEMDAIQRELADMEADKAALSSQIELLGGVSVCGDESIFHYADELAKTTETAHSEIMADFRELMGFAQKQRELWASVEDMSGIGEMSVPFGIVRERVSQMRKDFNEGKAAINSDLRRF